MSDLSAETERLATLIGAQTGKPRNNIDMQRVRELTRRVASRPLRDKRSTREIRDEAWRPAGDRGPAPI